LLKVEHVEAERVISGSVQQEEDAVERAIRPRRLEEYIGQQQVKTQLEIFISAARQRGEALDHVLIFGPPGWARRRWLTSSPPSWASTFDRPPGRCSSDPVTWPRC
jgi:hypothetical protein